MAISEDADTVVAAEFIALNSSSRVVVEPGGSPAIETAIETAADGHPAMKFVSPQKG